MVHVDACTFLVYLRCKSILHFFKTIMTMKRLTQLTFLLALLLLSASSCSETEYVGFPNNDIFPFEKSDTTISSDAHEFTITQTNSREGWEWKYWGVLAETEPDTYPNRVELTYDKQTGVYTADWIRVKIERTSTQQSKFTIWVDENTTLAKRSCLIYISTDAKGNNRYSSSFIIHQLSPKEIEEAKDSDATDNVLKVRYHGKIYQSEL